VVRISASTACGWLIMATCELSISTVVRSVGEAP
jgi:hypothetical protein